MPKRKKRTQARKRSALQSDRGGIENSAAPRRKTARRKRATTLTPDRQRHLRSILKRFKIEFTAKYIAGQKEHGGKLEDRDCAAEAAKEAIDLVAYIHCERVKRDGLVKILSNWNGRNDTAYDCLVKIRDLYFPA